MREIKFRAWVEVMESMISFDSNNDYLLCVGDAKPMIQIFSNGGEFIEAVDAGILMQYTGLKDKNGKEIYEGDIVTAPSGTISEIKDVEIEGEIFVAYKKNPPNQYIVSGQGYAFFLGTKNEPKYAGIINHSYNHKAFEIEIIGNIYENPELLED